jgi:magnesium-transporting ATPase (P-type)
MRFIFVHLFEAICFDQVGNRKLLEENGINISTEVESFVVELEESAKTGILVACNDILIGVLGVADSLKREAFVVIEGLQKMGITPVMVTGDNWRTARAVAKEVCICFSNIFVLVGNHGIVIILGGVPRLCFLIYAFNMWTFLVPRNPTSLHGK